MSVKPRRAANFEYLKDVSSADVFKGDQLAARLQRTGDGVEFRYFDDYLAASQVAVATTLPLTDHPLSLPAGAVPPFFAGLLPEGRRLSSLRRVVKTSADDDLSLLLAIGADTVGDVRVLPSGTRFTAPEPVAVVQKDFAEIRFSDLLGSVGVVDQVGLAGVQDKFSARMLSVPVAQAGRRFILKLDTEDAPHVVANEAYFVDLAAKAKFPVVRADVVHDSTGRPGLLVERFDRMVDDGGSAKSLSVEDGAQVLGIYPADKYNVTSERVVEGLSRLCAAELVALRDLYRQFCFAWLTGNGDLHAKNLSIVARDREWRVSSAYDLPTTLPYRDTTMALPIGGVRTGLSRRKLLEFAERIGLPNVAATRALDDVLDATEPIVREWRDGASPFSSEITADLARTLRHRRRTALQT